MGRQAYDDMWLQAVEPGQGEEVISGAAGPSKPQAGTVAQPGAEKKVSGKRKVIGRGKATTKAEEAGEATIDDKGTPLPSGNPN